MEPGRLFAVISIPVLILGDYYLTILGKKYREKMYSVFFASAEYELNPAWQKDINRLRLFNYKHLLLVFLVTVYFYFASKLMGDSLFEFFYGAIFIMFVFILARHLLNIFQYRYTAKHPELLSGKISISYQYGVKISQYQTNIYALVFLILNIRLHSWFLLGGTLGMLVLSLAQSGWLIRYKQKNRQKAEMPVN